MKLTTATVRSLALPPGAKDKTYFDDTLPAFGLRLREGGSRNFVVQYDFGGKTRRMTLGSVASLNLGKARTMAKDLLAAVRLGGDPAGDKREARERVAETFQALLGRYLDRKRAELRPRSFREVERHLQVHARPFHSRTANALAQDHRTVAARLAQIAETSGATTAKHVRDSLSGYFGWLMREGLADANPIARTNKPVGAGRDRDHVIADDELRAILTALGDDQFGAIVWLLALTGQRRSEIGSLRWSEVDLFRDAGPLIRLPGERVKNGQPHSVPLSPPALAILKAQPRRLEADGSPRDLIFGFGRGGFSDWSKAKIALDQRIAGTGVRPWRFHDLRRTMSTVMHDRLGIMPHIVEAVLNHTGGHKRGVAGTYNRASYDHEKRRALGKWAEFLETIVHDTQPATVVSLHA